MEVQKEEQLRHLADTYEQVQELRKAQFNRARAIKEGSDEHGILFAEKLAEDFHQKEKDIFNFMKEQAKQYDVYDAFLKKVKGIGPTYTTKLLAWLDIRKADKPSSFVSYCGLGVEMSCDECGAMEPRKPMKKSDESDEEYEEKLNEYRSKKVEWDGVKDGDECPECGAVAISGQAQQPVSGKPLGYNPKMKSLLWNVGWNFIRNNSQYKVIYDKEKKRKEEQNWGNSDDHRHKHAMRKMEKIFLHHLWYVWRKTEGLSTRSPYIEEYGNHDDIYRVQDIVPEVDI